MLSVLDLFSGAGGFSQGMKSAGHRTVGAIELDRFAVETFKENFPGVEVFQKKVEDCPDRWLKGMFSGADVVIGGPPCQGFSVAGPTQYGHLDHRNGLVLEMARVVSVLKPKFAVLENVKGILSGRLSGARLALDAYISALEDAGYQARIMKLQAANYGVPQSRERVFVIASREGEAELERIAQTLVDLRRPTVASGDCLGDLPSLEAGAGSDDAVPYATGPMNEYQMQARSASPGVMNHIAMKHTPRMIARLKSIGAGGSMKDVSAEHGQRARNTLTIDAGQRFKMNCSRIDPTRPAFTVPANFQTIHVHPVQHRMLTAREGARLQGFPDHFKFCGPRTLMSRKLLEREGRSDEIGLSQYNQVGNAVPPPLGQAIGMALSGDRI